MMESSTHFLYPATLFTSRDPFLITTILGSCVAVCLYDTRLQYGGINHYMLPFWNGQGLASPKYGNIAIHKLVEKMQSLGSSQKNLVAKVFGGSNMLETSTSSFMIGDRNVSVALEMLKEMEIQIISQSVSGLLGRKILYNTSTNEVRQKLIEKQQITNGNTLAVPQVTENVNAFVR